MPDMTLKEMNEQSYYGQPEVIWEMIRRLDILWKAWENGDFDNGPEFAWHSPSSQLQAGGNLLGKFWQRRTLELSPDERLLFALIADLNDRRGFDWDEIDDETKEEWLSEWLEIIRGDDDA